MDRNVSRFLVCFQPPFWVGVAERWDEAGYRVARVVFGAEPTDAQIYEWLEKEWHKLRFSRPEPGAGPEPIHRNPKRLQREARAAAQGQGMSTKAQEALARQREQAGLERKTRSREEKRAEEERKFLLRQAKKREKRRGR